MPFGLVAAGVGSLFSGIFGASAADKAAQEQAQSANNALDFEKTVYAGQQQNQAPFVAAGQTSIAQLMKDFSNGTFGPGSIPAFSAPTLDQARATPGYQFTLDQGNNSIQRNAAATGSLNSGGTLKALDSFGQGLADNTYGQIYNQALSTYGAQLSGQSQAFNQLLAPAQLGEGAATSINNTGSQAAASAGSLMTGIGNAQAAGTVGAANALGSGITGATNDITQYQQLQQILAGLNQNGGGFSGGSNPNLGALSGATYSNPLGTTPSGGSYTGIPGLGAG